MPSDTTSPTFTSARRKAATLATLIAAPSLALSAHAQAAPATEKTADGAKPGQTSEGTTKLADVTVIGQTVKDVSSPKYTEPLRDIPQTIVVIPSSVYSEQGATSLRDVLRNTPGITFQQGEGGSAPGDNLFIRGFGARNDIYVDGARDPGVLTRDTFNIESVEVSKGPSSATSGRGSTGGSVNQVSKMPRLDNFTKLEATVGNGDYKRSTLDVNQTLDSGSLNGAAVRVNAVWTDAGVVGRDEVFNKSWGIAPSFAIGLGTPTTLTLSYFHLHQNNLPDYGLPMTLPAGALAAGKTIDDLDWSNFYGLVSRDYEHVDSDAVTGIIEHKFDDDTSLRNLTRYGVNRRDAVVTPPRAASIPPTVPSATNGMLDPGYDPTVPQMRRTDTKYQDRDDKTLSNQTNLTTAFQTGTLKHALTTGIEVSREDQKSYSKVDDNTLAGAPNANRPPVTDLYHPDPNQPYAAAIHRTGAYTAAIADSGAIYAFDTLKFNPQWEVNFGGRYELLDVSYKTATAPTATTPSAVTRFQRTDDMFSWRGGIVFKPVESGSIYAGYGTSFNPSVDANQGLGLAATGATSANLAPEKNRSYELGTKWDLIKKHLAVSAALFRTEKTNARTTDAAGNTVLAGNQKVDGIELGATGNITEVWTVFAGYAYMDGKVDASGVSAQLDAQLTYVPKQSFNLWSTYRLPVGVTFGAGAQFTDGYFFALPSATATPAVSPKTRYWLYSAMASYPINKHLTLRLNINNLADEQYIDRGYQGHFTPGVGRTFLINASYSF
jgi:catecholate siderophore receptor